LKGMREADSTPGCKAESILNQLKTKYLGRTLTLLDQCTSTNDEARKLAIDGAPHGSLIITATQTGGRGRFGRHWASPRGGIWMTIIFRPPIAIPAESIPLTAALAVARSIHNDLQIDSQVGWPNDVVVHGFKLAGLIAESHQHGNSLEFILLGIGINTNFETRELGDVNLNAITLKTLTKRTVDNSGLICSILLELEELLSLAASDPGYVLGLLRKRTFSIGKKIRVLVGNRTIEGVLVDYKSMDTVLVECKDESVVVPAASAILVEYVY